MSEEQGETAETPADEPGDGADEPGDGADEPGDGADEPGDGADDAPERSAEEAEAEAESVDLQELEDLVEAHDTETVAREIAGLRERVEELERALESEREDREDLESRLKRKQAEFKNYKKRQSRRREEERARATEELVERLLEVRDNLRRALQQDDDADIREGVEATFRQLDDVLGGENVDPIEPEPGAEVDPQRHEVLLKVDGDQAAGTVEEVHRPGYEMADKVLRAARVTVAEGRDPGDESAPEADVGAGGADDADGGSAEDVERTEDASDEGPADGAAGARTGDETGSDADDGAADDGAADGDR